MAPSSIAILEVIDRLIARRYLPHIDHFVVVAEDPKTFGSYLRVDDGKQTSTNSLCFVHIHGGADYPIKNHQVSFL